MRVLVTGATGYIGSRLIPALLDQDHQVVVAAHSPDKVGAFAWAGDVEVRELDIEDDALVTAAVAGMEAVVYLVHSMDRDDFVTKDREAAQRVARACEQAGVGRIVYLSGLVPTGELSDHLRSRLEVEEVFLESDVAATVLRAAMVIGSGSTSFELLRRLSDRVPLVTPVPSWMRSDLQPIAIEDVVHLLTRALDGEPRNRHYDVGGDEVVSYPELLALYADVAGVGRRRLMVPWVPRAVVGRACAWISGMDQPTVSALVDSLSTDMVCTEDAVRRDLAEPGHHFLSLRESLTRSLRSSDVGTSRTGDVQAGASTDPQ